MKWFLDLAVHGNSGALRKFIALEPNWHRAFAGIDEDVVDANNSGYRLARVRREVLRHRITSDLHSSWSQRCA